MNLSQNITQLLKDIGPGQMSSTAYDTAWVARLAKMGEPRGIAALEWLRSHQMTDGTWGAESPKYYHDRLVCTLAAAIALATVGDSRDVGRIERARHALETVIPELGNEAMMETIGFEMIIPTLFDEAELLGIIQRKDYSDMERLNAHSAMKMDGLPGGMISRYVTLAFSAEMAGPDGHRLLDIPNLQEVNGSLGHSPSATAYFVANIAPENTAAKEYLYQLPIDDGGIQNVAPFDNFERSWTLWNLMQTGGLDDELLALCEPHLDFLEATWTPNVGAAFGHGYTPRDADMTSVIYEVLSRFGRAPDSDAILTYEGDDYFRCFPLEANPSVSVNIHVLGGLREAGFPAGHRSVQKIVRFLHDMQYWFDKWHSSPYYPTAHAVIACAGYLDELVADAISWILSTQNADGSWGYFMPTAEETAYSLQALCAWKRTGHDVDDDVLRRGAEWLAAHSEPPYPPLWIGKCLYTPVLVVRSAILSALLEVRLGEEVCETS